MNARLLTRRLSLAAAIVFAFPVAQAQDAPAREDRAARHLDRVQSHLDLTPEQADLVGEALAERDPGGLWKAAAALAPTLSAEQQAMLMAPPERPARPDRAARPGPPPHEGRRERPANTERPPRPDRSAHAEAMKAARDAALALSDEQAAAFDRLDAERRQRFEEHREQRMDDRAERQPRPDRMRLADGSPLPDEVAEILDPDQELIWLTFRALAPHPGGPRGQH